MVSRVISYHENRGSIPGGGSKNNEKNRVSINIPAKNSFILAKD
jgi:hypothetical protein